MATLKRASAQLFTRPDDERFPTLDTLEDHCRQVRESSDERWQLPGSIRPEQCHDQLGLEISDVGQFRLNDWSFGQVCGLADVQKETINRLLPATAARVLTETLPVGTKPVQVLTEGDRVRSIHGASYTRLFDSDLLDVVRNTADGFGPPPKGFNGATGLYAGQQDMFAFLIDDAEETLEALGKRGLPTKLLKDAVQTVARESGRFTVFAMVDALTRSTRALRFAGDRIEQDARIGALLSLAS